MRITLFSFIFLMFPLISGFTQTFAPMPVVPSAKQVEWQKMERIGFVHFTINTFTGREWGEGTESPALFNPDSLDARQWVRAAKAAGMKMLILTAKHHDGFCLWPSAYTSHSVKSSPWKNGKGDVVKEISSACHEAGIRFGIYLSPWDRHEPSYGTDAYNRYYENQVRELLTQYGPIAEFWMDGAKGENARNMEYDFTSWRKLIYQLQPNCVIFSDAGPDVRWIGNEAGIAGSTNWSMINRDSITIGKAPVQLLNTGDPRGRYWVPGECDVSIRPGWFYHASEDGKVKTALQLVDLYYQSVGRNSVFLLNLPPDKHGLIPMGDIDTLRKYNAILEETFRHNLAEGCKVTGKCQGNIPRFSASRIVDGMDSTFWAADDGMNADTLVVHLKKRQNFDRLVLSEPIFLGQRIAAFGVDALVDGEWKEIARGTTVGYKRILRFPEIRTEVVRIRICSSLATPALSEIGIYKASPVEKH